MKNSQSGHAACKTINAKKAQLLKSIGTRVWISRAKLNNVARLKKPHSALWINKYAVIYAALSMDAPVSAILSGA